MGIQRKIDYLNSLDAYRRTPYSEALRYQRKVLGTPDEAEIVAWEAKHSGGENKAMHEGNAPEFIISKTRNEFGRYK